MNRLSTIVVSTVVAGLVGSTLPVLAQPDDPRAAGKDLVRRVARVAIGHIEGVVRDERGAPLPGATVSALGSSNATAVTDLRGAFVLRALPAGSYVLRAERPGYLPSRRQFVQVVTSGATRFSLTLQRTDNSLAAPGLLAAGLAPGALASSVLPREPDEDDASAADDHGERAWRMRHLKRSILKEAEHAATGPAPGPAPAPAAVDPGPLSYLARAVRGPAQLLGELPFTGQVNFLTSGSFDGAPVLSAALPLRQVAFLSVGGPAWSHGDWSAQVMAQGDAGSWFVSGSYRRRQPATHLYDIGVSYSTQRFTPGSRWPIAQGSEGARSAGSLYAVDRWRLSRRATLTYGARFARYDYLGGNGLFSPRATLTLVPLERTRIEGTIARRMLAPGAEEFLEPLATGLWVPPERTFLGVASLDAERTNHYEVSVEQDLPFRYTLALRAFYQGTENQQAAMFGMSVIPGALQTGHYLVGNGGDVSARGWSVGISNMLSPYLRGSVAYTVTTANWLPGETSDYGLLLVGSGARPPSERLHDVTTALETDIPATATRVFVAYRLNTGFARRDESTLKPGLDARFDVQVVQRLPFLDFTSARWQAVLGVRNLFRDTAVDASVYDELLVIRPPKRVVTGLLVRF